MNKDRFDEIKRMANSVHIACEAPVANDISKALHECLGEIEELTKDLAEWEDTEKDRCDVYWCEHNGDINKPDLCTDGIAICMLDERPRYNPNGVCEEYELCEKYRKCQENEK